MAFLRRAVPQPPARRFDMVAIGVALCALQSELPRLHPTLYDDHDPFVDGVLDYLLTGYQGVDRLLAEGVDLFALGQSRHWLDLNCLVLCGDAAAGPGDRVEHREATERHFYDDSSGGIRDVLEWHGRHRGDTVWERAAGVFIRMLSTPQLFLEGNHRTGALVVSYMLGREGCPPLVIQPGNAVEFFGFSAEIRLTQKGSVGLLVAMPGLKERFSAFLKAQADERFLLPAV